MVERLESPQDDQLDKSNKLSFSINVQEEIEVDEQIGSNQPKRKQSQEIPRIKRRNNTINIRTNKHDITIFIPFDFEINRFFMSPEDLNIYDFKNYLQNTLNTFNSMKEFQIDKDYQATGIRKFFHYSIYFLIHLICGYLTFCLWQLLFFNLVLFITIIKFHMKFQSFTSNIINDINNKEKIRKMKEILKKENSKEICRNYKYTWCCGEHGYWLEMIKSI